jgi:hypothetical protein
MVVPTSDLAWKDLVMVVLNEDSDATAICENLDALRSKRQSVHSLGYL